MCHMSHVTCQVSHVICQMSHASYHLSLTPTKTLAAWQRCCAENLTVWWILRKFSPKFMLVCRKIPCKCPAVFMENLNKKYSVLLKKIPQKHLPPCWKFLPKLPLWLIYTKKCLYCKFPHKKSCLYEKFPQNFIWLEQQALLEFFFKLLF